MFLSPTEYTSVTTSGSVTAAMSQSVSAKCSSRVYKTRRGHTSVMPNCYRPTLRWTPLASIPLELRRGDGVLGYTVSAISTKMTCLSKRLSCLFCNHYVTLKALITLQSMMLFASLMACLPQREWHFHLYGPP